MEYEALAKLMVNKMITYLPFHENTSVALLTYGMDARVHVNLGAFKDRLALKKAVDTVPISTEGNRIDLLLDLVAGEVFRFDSGYNPKVPCILVLVTCRNPDIADQLDSEHLLRTGVSLRVLGIGHVVDKSKLLRVTDGKENRVIIVRNRDDAQNITVEFEEAIKPGENGDCGFKL